MRTNHRDNAILVLGQRLCLCAKGIDLSVRELYTREWNVYASSDGASFVSRTE